MNDIAAREPAAKKSADDIKSFLKPKRTAEIVKHLYTRGAAAAIIDNALPLCIVESPSHLAMFSPLNISAGEIKPYVLRHWHWGKWWRWPRIWSSREGKLRTHLTTGLDQTVGHMEEQLHTSSTTCLGRCVLP